MPRHRSQEKIAAGIAASEKAKINPRVGWSGADRSKVANLIFKQSIRPDQSPQEAQRLATVRHFAENASNGFLQNNTELFKDYVIFT